MKKYYFALLVVFSILLITSGMLFAAGGDMGVGTEPLTDGSIDYPYLIEDFADFNRFTSYSYYWDDYLRLESDIDLNPSLTGRKIYTSAVIAPDLDTSSSSFNGFQGTQFTGTFDGQNFVIYNLTIGGRAYSGLFGYIGSGAEVSNLGLENVYVSDMGGDYYHYKGGLAGDNLGSVSNCYVTGEVNNAGVYSYYTGGLTGANSGSVSDCHTITTVNGKTRAGGLVGINSGLISNCHADGTVKRGTYTGGLVGDNADGTISNCYATASVSGSSRTAGLIGDNGGDVSNCYATGNVRGGESTGGLAGYNHGSIRNSYSTSSVDAIYDSDYIGGLVGENESIGNVSNCFATGIIKGSSNSNFIGGLSGVNSGSISNCYASSNVIGGVYSDYIGGLVGSNSGGVFDCYSTGIVDGDMYVGGLLGYNTGSASNCFATGEVEGNNNSYTGGFVGLQYGNTAVISKSFWDTETSGTSNGYNCNYYFPGSIYLIGRTTVQMRKRSTFTGVGWDFSGDWWINDGRDYPKLVWQPCGDFDGDNLVNMYDFAVMLESWQEIDGDVNFNSVCELSGDNVINEADLAELAGMWLEGPGVE